MGRHRVVGSGRLLVASLVVLLAAGCDASWSTLGYGPGRTSHNPAESKLKVDNVKRLVPAWTAALPADQRDSDPVVADRSVFVTNAGTLRVYSADGATGCSGTPRVCQPTWTATDGGEAAPTVAGNVVYTVAAGRLTAFDARGVTGCGGTPRMCTPLWTARVGTGGATPAVANGRVYVGGDHLYAFDAAAGATRCTGTPKTCTPLWTSDSGTANAGVPAVANGVVYVTNPDGLSAFDANGTTGCAGSPKSCAPVWRFLLDPSGCGCVNANLVGPPSVSSGRVYITERSCCSGGVSSSAVLAFDAAGQDGCSASPKTCQPLATGTSGSTTSFPDAPIALAAGTAYASDLYLTAYDTNGLSRRWQADGAISAPAIANGVAYVIDAQVASGPTFTLAVRAYDAAGTVGCSGTPKRCTSLWAGSPIQTADVSEVVSRVHAQPAVANGMLYAGLKGQLQAYRLP